MALAIEKDGLRDSPNDNSSIDTSPSHAQSPEVSSNPDENEVQESVKRLSEKLSAGENEVQETVKSLTEKLSAALLNISAKEDLVKQHSKVAEEAVSGWEKAESEVAVLKQQLEATSQKNSALEDKISHLDGALKECVRQLRQSREEHEQKVHDAVTKSVEEWECNKSDLENQLIQLKKQLQTSKAEDTILVDNLQSKLEAIEKENAALKVKLLTLSEELKIRILERELSTQTAETASKQHLESIKKVAKLEAECRKLRAVARKTSSVNDHKTISSSAGVESLTDSQSDNGDRLLGMDNEPSCSDSWASALIAELDQFKNEKAGAKVLTSSVDIDLMDDFLEMERLASMPEADNESSSFGLEADSNRVAGRESSSNVEDEVLKQKMAEFEEKEVLKQKMAELEEKVVKLETEKAKVETALADSQNQLGSSHNQLSIADGKLVQLRKDLELAKESKQAAKEEAVSVDAKRKVLESELKSTVLELEKLQDKVVSLEGKVEESVLSSELKTKLETSEETREAVESQLHLARVEVENLCKKLGLLECRIEEERARSTEFAAKADAAEAMRKAMESQFLSADLEVRKLQQEVNLLQQRIEDEVSLSTEFAAKVEAVEGERKALEYELELAHSEVQKLSDKVGLLEEEVHNERTLSTEFAAKCHNFEDELSKKRREAEVRVVSCSNGEISVKQEKELAKAAEKLAECQKTIASLGRHLKSLTTLDDFMLESEKSELNRGSPNQRSGYVRIPNLSDSSGDITISTLSNGKERGSPQSPPSSTLMLSGIGRLLSQSRSSSRIEN